MSDDSKKAEPGLSSLTRRDVIAHGISLGFAAAVGSISAFAVSTDSTGLATGETKIKVGPDSIPAYWAAPQAKGPHPILLVCHEIFGVHEHIRDVCRRFAKSGFLAIAPDLFFRYGDVVKMKEIDEIISKVVSKVSINQLYADLDATIEHAKKNGGDPRRVAVTGFCWGGRTVWLYSAKNKNLKAGVAWYGPLIANPGQKESAVEVAPSLTVPVLGLYGGKDSRITAEHVHQMETALAKGKSDSKIVVYPDAPHGFFADYRESYRKADAEDAFKKAIDWFKKYGAI